MRQTISHTRTPLQFTRKASSCRSPYSPKQRTGQAPINSPERLRHPGRLNRTRPTSPPCRFRDIRTITADPTISELGSVFYTPKNLTVRLQGDNEGNCRIVVRLFFKDCEHMIDHMAGKWPEYRLGQISLTNVALLSNVATDLVENS